MECSPKVRTSYVFTVFCEELYQDWGQLKNNIGFRPLFSQKTAGERILETYNERMVAGWQVKARVTDDAAGLAAAQ